jgi:DHA1 family bicyclomycin/chloramphenicol resistance-like MFS transporter
MKSLAAKSLTVRPPLFILVLCSAVQPFALNVLAPATPAIANALGSDYGTIQLTLTLYLATVAASQLLVGPVSDRIGRRPCIVGGLALFTAGSVVGLLAADLWMLLLARMIQAAGAGTAFALVRAMARDIGGRDEAASLIGYVTMAMVVAPMVAPLIGGALEKAHGWRAIFLAMGAIGAVATIGGLMRLPETRNPAQAPTGWLDAFRAFPKLARERAFLVHAGGLALTSGVFFAFIAGAPYVVVEHLRADPTVYGAWFMTMSGSYMLGNFITGRFTTRVGAERLARIGNAISLTGVTLAAAMPFTGHWSPALIFLPLMLNGVGNGLSIPTLTAASLSVRPELAGAAAGLMGFAQLSLGAAMSWLSGHITPLWPPAFLMMMLAATIAAAALPWLALPLPKAAGRSG